jgi:hypothetical protein
MSETVVGSGPASTAIGYSRWQKDQPMQNEFGGITRLAPDNTERLA